MKLRGLYKVERTGVWYFQPPMSKGIRPKAISLGTKDEQEAVGAYYAMLAQVEEQFRRGSLRMESARYIAAKRNEAKHTPATTEHAERVLGQVIAILGNREVAAYRKPDMIALRDHWREKKLAPASIASYFTRIAAFFAWAVAERLTDENPVSDLDYQRNIPTRAERYCTKEERERLMASLPEDRLDLALCFWLGFFAGIRRNEIVEARRDWVDLEAGVLHVRRTDTFLPKGKKARQIRLSPRLLAFLSRYMALPTEALRPPAPLKKDGTRNAPAEIFPALVPGDYLLRPDRAQGKKQKTRGKKAWRYRYDPRAPFEAHVAGAGLDWVTFHTMRHTFASLHALAGTPLTILAKELGDDYKVVYETYVGYQRGSTHASAVD